MTYKALPEYKDLPLQYLDSLDFLIGVITFYAINTERLCNSLDQKEKMEHQNPYVKHTIINLEKCDTFKALIWSIIPAETLYYL